VEPDVVELRLRDGWIIQIGTDDPKNLLTAIESSLPQAIESALAAG